MSTDVVLVLCDGKTRWTARSFSENQLASWIQGLPPDKMLEVVSLICGCFKCMARWRFESPVARGYLNFRWAGGQKWYPVDVGCPSVELTFVFEFVTSSQCVILSQNKIRRCGGVPQCVIMLYHVYRCFAAQQSRPTCHFGPRMTLRRPARHVRRRRRMHEWTDDIILAL